MAGPLVEEIDRRTYNPNVYFTSNEQTRPRSKGKISKMSNSNYRSVKRVNYSLADMEAQIYAQDSSNEHKADNINTSKGFLDRFTPQQIIQSKRRFMELDTENIQDLSEIPSLLSSMTGLNKDKIDTNTTTVSHGGSENVGRSNRNKFEIPKTLEVSYRSTKPHKSKKKNTNRIVALKKILATKRQLHTYIDTMSQVDKSIILHNIYNKKYFKVLPLITICSICGGYDSISSCVKCSDKICSLKCFKLHNETRCAHR